MAVKKELTLKGLNCANCASKIEDRVSKLENVNNSNLNFAKSELVVEFNPENEQAVIKEIEKIVKDLEPDVQVIDSKDIEEIMEEEVENNNIIKIIIGLIIFILAILLKNETYKVILFLVSYFIIGGEILLKSIKSILKGQLFDENFLMSLATVGAIYVKQYPEAVAVMLLYQIGEYFQDMAVNHSRKSISELMDIKPDYANLVEGINIKKVSPEDVNIGDVILIKPGEKVPLDGVIIEGNSSLDVSALTGESLPKDVDIGDSVLSGSINNNKLIKLKVTKDYDDSTVTKILNLVENASSKKAETEKFITRFSKVYTPIVVIAALTLAVLPPILFPGESFSTWVYRASIFLVVSCPCALVISIPLSFFAGVGKASKDGILIKGGNYLEGLNNINTVVFDKTGTLTKGNFSVSEIVSKGDLNENQILRYAAIVESNSNHPIAKSIVSAYEEDIDNIEVENFEEIAGKGVRALVEGTEVTLGKRQLIEDMGIEVECIDNYQTVIYISIDNKYAGYIVISDEIKKDSKETIDKLKALGVNKIVMLSGDKDIKVNNVGEFLGIDEVYGELLPHEKIEMIEKFDKEKSKEEKIIFIGDGINDAPVLARSDIGIAMGGIGSDAAIQAADIVIMTDEPLKIVTALNISQRLSKIIWSNIIFILAVKFLVLILAALGMATMWAAVFADVGVALISVLNSMRILK